MSNAHAVSQTDHEDDGPVGLEVDGLGFWVPSVIPFSISEKNDDPAIIDKDVCDLCVCVCVFFFWCVCVCLCVCVFANQTPTLGPPHVPLSIPLENINLLMIKLLLSVRPKVMEPRGGGGVLTPNFGRYMYVPRQSGKWAQAPERAPGRA